MFGNPNTVGEARAFNWTVMDRALADSASRSMHAGFRVVVDFPGLPGQKMPQYLIDQGIEYRNYPDRPGSSPFYGDPILLEAMEQFVRALGKRYDGDKRLSFVQAGLIGFWGEWHTSPYRFVPDEVRDKVVAWYAASFFKTKVQTRFALYSSYDAGFGLHDDSFTFETLDGVNNGGVVRNNYFWPTVTSMRLGDIWKFGMFGGKLTTAIYHL
jgi:hypothetical protein